MSVRVEACDSNHGRPMLKQLCQSVCDWFLNVKVKFRNRVVVYSYVNLRVSNWRRKTKWKESLLLSNILSQILFPNFYFFQGSWRGNENNETS